MKAAEIFALGYAIPLYDIDNNTRIWRYAGQGQREKDSIRLPAYAVPLHDLAGVNFKVAKWSDVIKAQEEYENSRNR